MDKARNSRFTFLEGQKKEGVTSLQVTSHLDHTNQATHKASSKSQQHTNPNNHPKHKTQIIHHLLLIIIFTFSTFLASLKKFRDEEFECAVCLEPCTNTLINPECSHRFCGKCIKESLNKCNHECPTCRVPIPTYRTCRRDPQFDRIVSTSTFVYVY